MRGDKCRGTSKPLEADNITELLKLTSTYLAAEHCPTETRQCFHAE